MKLSLSKILKEFKELPDDPNWATHTPEELYDFYEISKEEMDGWIASVSKNGFTKQLYNEIASRVGDMDNFMLNVQEAMPETYKLFDKSGLQKAIPELETNPEISSLGKPPPQQRSNKMTEEDWEELRNIGREVKYKDPEQRAYSKWKEDAEKAQMAGQPPPPPPTSMFGPSAPPMNQNVQKSPNTQNTTQPKLTLNPNDMPTNPGKKLKR